jgi:hypothetical protein
MTHQLAQSRAFENIRLAASYFDVHMTEKSWHDLMPH